ncbi:Panacea domain-containing protein [Tropicimonas sp. IMCC34011]|uniref:Panacea domain-containing protein n=1 Tax=Tropicimonas sp. IMCC34011 TaxID=2248759 RepID=UPI000E25FA58|nr:type II toxin-antitoxin system antitoxin SocA domain-containing protein [Tropicimonas sp. IMCC34011]
MTVRSIDAARHLCERSGWLISNLKLQKILYLADLNFVGQGFGRLVDEDFEAWDYGPVLPSIYRRCKAFGAKPIPNIFWGTTGIGGTDEAEMLDLAWGNLRHLTAGQLVSKTHSTNGAWARRYAPGLRHNPIPTDDMIDEYRAARGTAA